MSGRSQLDEGEHSHLQQSMTTGMGVDSAGNIYVGNSAGASVPRLRTA